MKVAAKILLGRRQACVCGIFVGGNPKKFKAQMFQRALVRLAVLRDRFDELCRLAGHAVGQGVSRVFLSFAGLADRAGWRLTVRWRQSWWRPVPINKTISPSSPCSALQTRTCTCTQADTTFHEAFARMYSGTDTGSGKKIGQRNVKKGME